MNFNHKGLTLIELITTMLIISILSIVAVPIFRDYQLKAYKSEGKLLLAQGSRALDVFYSEHQSYANCVTFMGMGRPDNGRYTFGFTNAWPPIITAPTLPSACNNFTTLFVWYPNDPGPINAHLIHGTHLDSQSNQMLQADIIGGISSDGQKATMVFYASLPIKFSVSILSMPLISSAQAEIKNFDPEVEGSVDCGDVVNHSLATNNSLVNLLVLAKGSITTSGKNIFDFNLNEYCADEWSQIQQ